MTKGSRFPLPGGRSQHLNLSEPQRLVETSKQSKLSWSTRIKVQQHVGEKALLLSLQVHLCVHHGDILQPLREQEAACP